MTKAKLDLSCLPDWQKQILENIDPRLHNIYLVDDPDCLLAEESLQLAFLANGTELYFYDDSIALRYFLEHKIKPKRIPCVISFDSNQFEPDDVPFDIAHGSGHISISLTDCFPQLSYSVLKSLQMEELNALDEALQEFTPGNLNESASSDFVLRHVFKLAPEVISGSSDLLRALLRIHYRDIELPVVLKKRLIALLRKRSRFKHWPLDSIISEREGFFEFLQVYWSGYVDEVVESLEKGIKEPESIYQVNTESAEKIVLPFGHDDVRIYIDNLFVEGYLTPIEIADPEKLTGHWCLVGVKQDPDKELEKRFCGLLKLCEDTLPTANDRHQHWQQYAYRLAELSAIQHHSGLKLKGYEELCNKVDDAFSEWLLAKFSGLHNHPPKPPVMLHHVPRAMAREIQNGISQKTALILIDGLAIDQWITAKQEMIGYDFDESTVFAWVPTVTSVSRQALFSAKAPYQFAKTIATTSSEPKAWQQFWQDQGLDKNQVYYEKGLGTDDIDALIERLSDRRFKAVGLVINTVDDMMHGMLLGAAGMHNQVKLWAQSGYLTKLIDNLLVNGFSIHITSDHGNVEAVGSGKINEGAIAESRGERTRVYETENLRQSIETNSNDVADWPQAGLPNDYWPKVMKSRKAFVADGERIVGHGGIAIEEVIVPYITICRDKNDD